MSETDLVRSILISCSLRDQRLWRNNVGSLQDRTGRWVRYGLAVGSTDLVGLKSVTVTPDMVGQRIAVFVGIEAKDAKKGPTQEQAAFLAMLREMGARAGIARSVEDAHAIIEGREDG